jgi:transposase-like protein
MVLQTEHIIERVEIYLSGAERWLCPKCGREFVVRWYPSLEKIFLEYGDLKAEHLVVVDVRDYVTSVRDDVLVDMEVWGEAFDDL